MSDMSVVKAHFESEAKAYDDIIVNLVPKYREMVEALAASLPYEADAAIIVCDLGCGTGTIAKAVLSRCPNARITCVDIAENMLEMAEGKLADAPDARYLSGDFYTMAFDRAYDVMVSSLALHHLVTDEDKQAFYAKACEALKPGGMLVNADVILGATEALQALNMKVWREFMLQNISVKEADGWVAQYYAEDHPVPVSRHIELLKGAGFAAVDVVWKHYGGAVIAAVKA